MMHFASFNIIFSSNPSFYFLLVVALIGFSIYIYKHTIPLVSEWLRYFLTAIRSIILALIVFLLFDPLLAITHKLEVESKTYLFVDNSNSLAEKDSVQRTGQINNFVNELNSAGGINIKIFTFGRQIDSVKDLTAGIRLNENKTNFSQIVNFLNKEGAKVNSAVIVSDGIITDGIDPTYQAEKFPFPLFTVGIGDTAQKKDVQVSDVRYNQYIYSDKPTVIEASIKNFGFAQKLVRASFFEEGKPLASKDLTLNEAGINKIFFDYKPSGEGEKKLSIVISPLPGEYITTNNSKTFFINVLDTKLKICLVAGAPSADLSAIANALTTDKNLDVRKLIQLANGRFLNDAKAAAADSSDLLFLIDFPSSNTPQNLIDKISTLINEKSKPFFLLLSAGVNIQRLKSLEKNLPFSISKTGNDFAMAEPEMIGQEFSSFFSGIQTQHDIWQNLPPLTQSTSDFQSKPGSTVLVRAKIRNTLSNNPLIILRSIGNQRSFAILGGELWKWQLQTAEAYPAFFQNFINYIAKWLGLSNQQKQFQIYTDKKNYLGNETVNFKAELYDQTFTPVDTAKISAHVLFNNEKYDLIFSPDGNGLYSTDYNPNQSGDYTYTGLATINGKKLTSNSGRFVVSGINIEKVDTRMQPDFLKLLAENTGGNYYTIYNYKNLVQKLQSMNKETSKERLSKSEFQLWADEWILLLIIFLFAVEWFVRKRSGMI